jgi:beta-lactamase class A
MRNQRLTSPRHFIPTLLVAAALLGGCASPLGARTGVTTASELAAASAAPAVESLVPAGPPMTAIVKAVDMTALRKQLQQYIDQQSGTYGIYVVDLNSGKGMGINGDLVFPAASTFKLPMALYILDQAAKGKADLDEPIAYLDSDYEEGTGTLQDTIQSGDQYPVRKLLELAITESDNIATQMLLRRFGQANVDDYMHKLGGKVTRFDPETWGTTPREMAMYMKDVQSNGVMKDPKLRAFLMGALEHTAFDDRTAAGVPDGVPVAHKIGTLDGVINDVALVLAPDHPFVISVYSMDVSEDVAPDVIAQMTRMVYNAITAAK